MLTVFARAARSKTRLTWALLVMSVAAAGCSNEPDAPADAGAGGAAGTEVAPAGAGGAGGEAGTGGASGQAAGGASGQAGAGGAGGHAGGGGAGMSSMMAGAGGEGGQGGGDDPPPDYGPGTVQPDTPLTEVADCTGVPDFALCDVMTTPDRDYDVCMAGVCISPGCGTGDCNTQGVHFLVPPPGEERFEKSGDAEPITIDKITGLHWQSCFAGVSGASCDQGTPTEMLFDEAIAYCDALAYGGHDDWYVPDPNELLSIGLGWVDPNAGANSFPNFKLGQETMTSSTSTSHGFQVNEDGTMQQFDKDWGFSVRCVRRGFSTDAGFTGERFEAGTPAGDSTVSDRATRLMWLASPMEAADGTREFMVSEAPAACAALVYGGFSDWRLPSYRELHSLYNYPAVGVASNADLNPLFPRSGPYLIAAEGILIAEDGGSVSGGGTYPAYCVRGPLAD